jgi:hypothetical protein
MPDWPVATPAEAGMDAAKLTQAKTYALTGGGSGYIIRGGRLVMSWGNTTTKYDLKSTTKSNGRLALDHPAVRYHESLGVPPNSNLLERPRWLDGITIRHLATHTAGFEKDGGYPRLLFAPGTAWAYSDGGANWLAEVLTLTYQQDLNSLFFSRIFAPLGILSTQLSWRRNAHRSDKIQGIKNREFGSGISASVDALARIGYLYLREGRWQEEQLIPRSFVAEVRRTQARVGGLPVVLPQDYGNASDHYGVLWWNNADGTLENVPRDAYWSWGLKDSLIIVIPSLDIVVSRAGDAWREGWTPDYEVLRPFIEPIVESVQDVAPTTAGPGPSSKVISVLASQGIFSGLMKAGAEFATGSLSGRPVFADTTVWNTRNTSQSDSATYTVSIPEPGRWYIWARLYYPGTTAQPTNDPNSFWVAVNGRAGQILGNNTDTDGRWHWRSGAEGVISLGTLSQGLHTIRVWNREAKETVTTKLSPRLDALILTRDANFLPSDSYVQPD